MILKAITNGVTEARIAAVLNVDVERIRRKCNLLDGICPEVVDLLRNKRTSNDTFASLRKMKPLRQIEAAELMLSGDNFSAPFAAAILRVTRPELLVEKTKKQIKSQAEETSKLLGETTYALLADLAAVRRSYGTDVLSLSVICRCMEKLLENKRVERYLQQHHAGTSDELKHLIAEVNQERAQPRATNISRGDDELSSLGTAEESAPK